MLVKVKFEKGAVGSVHEHHHIQVSYVESGAFEMTIGDKMKILKAGMVFMFRRTFFMDLYVLSRVC